MPTSSYLKPEPAGKLASLILIVGLSSLSAGGAAAQSRPAPLTLEPYAFELSDGSAIAAERGVFEAPERRGNPASRNIRIGFVRFKSTAPHPGPPIVYLAGGPGASGVEAARGPRQSIFLALREAGDVIALDQRGVGWSNAIPPCTADAPMDPALGLNEAAFAAYSRATLTQCVAFWRDAGVSVEGYTTRESADDLEDLRQALGAPQLDLWAISYGTHLALETMRRHPSSIHRVVLASAEGLDQTVKRPSRVDAAFGRLGTAAKAGGVTPELVATMRRVHDHLDAEPLALELEGPDGAVNFMMDAFALRMLAGGVAKNPDGVPQLAQLYEAFDAGQGQALGPLLYGAFLKDPLVMSGMPELMDLASGVSPERLARVQAEAPASIVGDATNFPMPQLLGVLPEIDLGPAFRREIQSNIPTLLFSGDLDVRTPLEEQAEATIGLTRLTRIVVHNGGHDLFEAHPAIPSIILAFLAGRPVATDTLDLPLPSPGPVESSPEEPN